MKHAFAAVIPAAGLSSRLPAFKPLLALGDTTTLGRVVRACRQARVRDIIVVTGYRADEVAAEADRLGARAVHNPDFLQGMFSSVRAGLAALSDGLDGAFVHPVDIPLVRSHVHARLMDRFAVSDAPVFFPVFDDRGGHPPLIRASRIGEVLAYQGRGGLRGALATMDGEDVEVACAQIHFDMDDDAAYFDALGRLARLDVPSPDEALVMLTAYFSVGEKGLAHARAVSRAALALALALNRLGAGLDKRLVESAALLHDLAKGKKNHEEEGGRELLRLGFPVVADIVACHRDLTLSEEARVTEKEIVYLADKLVRCDRYVGLEARFREKLDMFADDPEAQAAIRGRRGRARAVLARVEREAGLSVERILALAGMDVSGGTCAG
ncbi:DVU_1551 family NTP transferase [Desulfolutivibrio sulfoxidireducens]|uniref:DVU_1551 family NTP transferase n=1 Tax=Desulfolutivibrio sulfoxidireducens TaxID=2773299 RepID=UPI00159E8174|nr:NTP transferase domain-containing protein [Desulfolutivibrio sulfoxidireducens]QLA19094.1 NTP transferase domain-containing protein [Desulfolutivibrio sulfoxidireducens]